MTLLELISITIAILFTTVSLFLFAELLILKLEIKRKEAAKQDRLAVSTVPTAIATPQAAAIAQAEKGKLTSLISSLADGIFMVDTNKNLLIINDVAKSFLNITSQAPTFTEILSAISTQYDLLNKINQVLETNKQITESEIKLNNKIFQAFITPVVGAQKPIGASILLHDITVEKNVSKIKEDFTHMIVHELRAPLTAMKDSSELVLEANEGQGTLSKDEQAKLLKIIDQQCKNLLEQINEILDAAKIEAGSFAVNKTETDLQAVVQNAVDSFLAEANKKQITLSALAEGPLPKIDADSVRIAQVLNNLISNSLKFTPAGGKITISVKPGDGILTVAVKDSGMGIPLNEQKDLFSKYYQVRTMSHELAKKGTGLGLYITKGVVEAHGGSVGVISSPGQGTTIYFTLPYSGGLPKVIQGHNFDENKPKFASLSVN